MNRTPRQRIDQAFASLGSIHARIERLACNAAAGREPPVPPVGLFRDLTTMVTEVLAIVRIVMPPELYGAGCDDPSRIADAEHIRRLQLEEVADGAYGDGPLARAHARRRLHDFGLGSREQSFAPAVLDAGTGREVMSAQTALYLTPKERAYVEWAVRSSIEAQDSGPPEMLTDPELAELIDVLRDGDDGEALVKGETHVPAA